MDPADDGRAEPSPPASSDEEIDGNLGHSLVELAGLANRHHDLEELLTSVAVLAVRAIPGAEGAGLTLLESGRSQTIVATNSFVSAVDDIQYNLGQGPCITAADTALTVTSGSLGADRRWTRFGAQVARLGVHSVLSLPLLTPDGVVGAMNVYAHRKHAFSDSAARIGELFSAPAAIAVQNAQVLEETKRLVARLQATLNSRAAIDRAIGILMSRSGISEHEALERLRVLSQRDHQKLAAIAERIVDGAVRRARARQIDENR